MTPQLTTMTICRRQRGAETDGQIYNKGHFCQQQQNSDYKETPAPTTSTASCQIRDANNDDDIPTTTTTMGRQR